MENCAITSNCVNTATITSTGSSISAITNDITAINTGWYFPQTITFDNTKIKVHSEQLKDFKFPGGFVYSDENGEIKRIYITKVYYRNPATVVFWSDGTRTIAKAFGTDDYNPTSGLLICVLKKLYGGVKINELIKSWLPDLEGQWEVTVKDVRRKQKKHKKENKENADTDETEQ